MRSLYNGILLIVLSLLLVQCQKDLSYVGGPDATPVTPQPITAHIQGNVTDENGQPAQGVNITIGTKTATTNADGYFRILQASLNKTSALVTAEKAGYFKAYRSFAATSGTNQVVIKLIKRDLAGTASGATGGEVSLTNGTKIGLKAGGVVVASTGVAYTGTVNVYAANIDPTAADINEVVPGSFMANNAAGNRVALSSYGMVAVELEGAAGEKLQIKSGSTSTLTMAIPASLQSSAPATIPMWYIDEQTGIWKEEGSAVKSGNNYVTEVKHFSFWNCDIQVPAIMLSMTIKNKDTLPMSHVLVRITRNLPGGGTITTAGWTDSLGQVSGLVPKNETLQMSILGPCYTAIYTQNIGPFNTNTNIGTIILPATTTSVVTVKGKLLTCAGTPVMNGFAGIKIGTWVRYAATDTGGNYHSTFVVCGTSNNVSIYAVDVTAGQQSTLQTFAVTAPVTNAPNISACGTTTAQFINYTLDGGTMVSISSAVPSDSLMIFAQSGGTTGVTVYVGGHKNVASVPPVNTGIDFNIIAPSAAPGTYPMRTLSVNGLQANAFGIPITSMPVTFTNFPTIIGQFYEGSFSGTFTTGSPSVTHTLSGQFRLRKNF